ncbi:MAG: isoleucine--tRNA ligase [Gemmatimonadetes bacterium]|nr:isoleucine--tRNA ligase [Gemmatimonadota bacterium]
MSGPGKLPDLEARMTGDEAHDSDRFPRLPPDVSPQELETQVLSRWEADQSVKRALINGADGSLPAFNFYDGPPTANGRPGIHHVFARTVKDLFSRHRAMHGFYVPRKAGWDTHGLPVEIEVEKALGINGKQDIERIGVEEFNRRCRESVWKYREEWERLVSRIGHWLDYEQPYVTYENEYIESEWWALKTLHGKGLLYRGHKILPYCARCGTTLSSHEVAQGYEDVEDPSVYVALDLENDNSELTVDGSRRTAAGPVRRRIVAWTTTPWTLVSNAALAVHPDLAYIEVQKKAGREWTLILAEARAAAVLGEGWAERWDVVATHAGRDLAGKRYTRPLDWAPYLEGNHEIIVAEEFVSADDGSGVVHMSPAFGADDYAAGKRHGLAFLQPVNARGEFPADMPVVGGKFVKEADALIIEELKKRDVIWKAGTLMHSYPHCWRCGTPLLYYARTSWFVRTTAFKDEMLARNAAVNWNPPEMGSGRFGEWLENNIDWAISRDRYWGTPLPVWICDANDDHRTVIGSYAELAENAGHALGDGFDPHKPYIDDAKWTWACAECEQGAQKQGEQATVGTMRRVPEVIDAWFDSGSMPFAQWHFPFENTERVAREYPADYIAEGVDQTRGWFYSLLAIAAGLGDALPNNGAGQAAPYRAVVVNDLVRDAKGQKMSKSRGNTVDPWSVIERHGADAVRLFLIASSQVWTPKNFDEQAIRDTAGRFLITLRNLYHGAFAQYANFGWEPSPADPLPADRPLLDRWVLSRLASVEAAADKMLERFDATSAARAVMQFIDDDVSKWYVRLAKRRMYAVDSPDNRAAFATLHEVLFTSCRLLAPFAPFVTDWMHRALTGDSVHSAPYVRSEAPPSDAALDEAMAAIRALASAGRAARETAKVNVRQPLARVVCVTDPLTPAAAAHVPALVPILAAELNVKLVEFATNADALVSLEAKPNFRALGKVFGKETPRAAAAVAALSSESLQAFERGEPVLVNVDGREHTLASDDLAIVRKASGTLVVHQEGTLFAAIDPTVTPELRSEGIARELVSRTQRLRKESGLDVSDRIILIVAGTAPVLGAVTEHRQWIAGEVLARDIVIRDTMPEGVQAVDVELDGMNAKLALTKDS